MSASCILSNVGLLQDADYIQKKLVIVNLPSYILRILHVQVAYVQLLSVRYLCRLRVGRLRVCRLRMCGFYCTLLVQVAHVQVAGTGACCPRRLIAVAAS